MSAIGENVAKFALDGTQKRGREALVDAAMECICAAAILLGALPAEARRLIVGESIARLPELAKKRAIEMGMEKHDA